MRVAKKWCQQKTKVNSYRNETRIWVNITDRNKVLFLSKHIHYDTILKSLMLTSSLPTWPYSQAKQRKWNICFLRVPWDLAFMAISAFKRPLLEEGIHANLLWIFLATGSCKVSAQEPNIHWRMSNKAEMFRAKCEFELPNAPSYSIIIVSW